MLLLAPQNPSLQRPPPPPTQSVEEIQRLVQMARTVGPVQPNIIDTGEQLCVLTLEAHSHCSLLLAHSTPCRVCVHMHHNELAPLALKATRAPTRHCYSPLCAVAAVFVSAAEGAIDEAMAEVLDEEFPAGGMMDGGGGAGFVV